MNSLALSHQYREMQVKTSDPPGLVLMLYDIAIQLLNSLIKHKESKPKTIPEKLKLLEERSLSLIKVQQIILELKRSLNLKIWAEGQTLYHLYEYLYGRLIEANLKQVDEPIEEAFRILSKLREAWGQAAVVYRQKVKAGGYHLNAVQ